MKKFYKRGLRQVIACLLLLAMIAGMLPQQAMAASKKNNNGKEVVFEEDGYQVTYRINSSWGSYVNADVTITNVGTTPIEDWRMSFPYDGKIENIWNADVVSYEDNVYVLKCKDYNKTISIHGSVNFGFIACGESLPPTTPQSIYVASEAEFSVPTVTPDATPTPEPTQVPSQGDLTGRLPEQWNGLNYALFTSGSNSLQMNTNETYIGGDVRANSDVYFRGTKLQVNGTISSTGDVTANTSSMDGAMQISAVKERVENLAMPDITKELREHITENGAVYMDGTTFQDDYLVIDESILVNGSVSFNTTSLLGSGVVYATDSIQYNVGELATPDTSRAFLCAEQGDITLNGSEFQLNAVLYAPNGCVYVNANRFTLNGRIIAKQVCINGTMIRINAGSGDYDMLDFIFRPHYNVLIEGNQKENRKIVLSVEEVLNTEQVLWEETKWEFFRNGEAVTDEIAIDETESDVFRKEMIFRKAGNYEVAVTVTNGQKEYTETLAFVIAKDMEPYAGFTLAAKKYQRDSAGVAEVLFTNTSYSVDNDALGSSVWSVYHDADNDGVFAEEEKETYTFDGSEDFVFTTDMVGRYQVELFVKETYSDTIPSLISEEDFLTDTTEELPAEVKCFEVVNVAPVASLDIEKAKAVDVVFTVGSASQEEIQTYADEIAELEERLKELSIDANISTVSTSTLTAQDTFAWKEFDHYNYRDSYLPTIAKHILYTGNDIKMVGYSWAPLKDFLYVADNDDNQKIFEFDLQRDGTDWHSMEGGGFLFNTVVSEESNYIRGYCILVTQVGLKLVQINCNNLSGFRNGSYSYVQNAGRLLQTFPISNVYANHHFKIVVDGRNLSVWDGDKLVINNYLLPEAQYGYGYGPIISHASHGCRQQSYFTFKNIKMHTITGADLSDVISDYPWREGAGHYVVHFSNSAVDELAGEEEMAALTEALLEQEVPFIGIGTDENKNQYLELLNATLTGGLVLPAEDLAYSMEETTQYITDAVLAKNYEIGDLISDGDRIEYVGYYSDEENDTVYAEQWEYEYDPSIFDNEGLEGEHIVCNVDEPMTMFENVGAYTIRLRVQDDPTDGNDALAEYRLWSGEEQYDRLLVVHSRPHATVEAQVYQADTSGEVIVNTTYDAWDTDHSSDAAKGIREESYCYKAMGDGEWTEGKFPNRIEAGQNYLIRYQVQDAEGAWSKPAVAVVMTEDYIPWEAPEDNENPQPVIEVSREIIGVGEEVRIDGYALDNYGVDEFSLYINGEKVMNAFGRTFYTPNSSGVIVVKATATDLSGNYAETERRITVTGNTVVKSTPEITITSPTDGAVTNFDLQFVGSITDKNGIAGYTLSYKAREDEDYTVFAEGTEAVENGVLGILPVETLDEGVYDILIRAENTQGVAVTQSMVLTKVRVEVPATPTPEITPTPEATPTPGVTPDPEVTPMPTVTPAPTATPTPAAPKDETIPELTVAEIVLDKDENTLYVYGSVSDETELSEYTVRLLTGDGQTEVKSVQGTENVEDGTLAAFSMEDAENGTYLLEVKVTDASGNWKKQTFTVTYQKQEDIETGENGSEEGGETGEEEPDRPFTLTVSKTVVAGGEVVKILITLPKNADKSTLTVKANGEELPVVDGYYSFAGVEPGEVELTAEVTTTEGEVLTRSVMIKVYDDGDTTAPVAKFITPEADSAVKGIVEITATVTDETALDSYVLEYRMEGEEEFTELARGTEPVEEGVVGTLDTTILRNGRYELRLTATDKGGNYLRTVRTVSVEGELKLGHMSVGFTDVTSKIAGNTLQVNRFYDSRNKEQGAFGIGWTLGMEGSTLWETNPIYEGYKLQQVGSLFSTGYYVEQTLSHDIVVSYGDGTSDRFELKVTPERQALVPITEFRVSYRCVTNDERKLELVGDNGAFFSGGNLALFYDDSVYELAQYKLTMEDDTVLYLDAKNGVTKIQTPNGTTIYVTEDGYVSDKDEESVRFLRDTLGRIIEISTPEGNTVTYTYDEAGNLSTMTDALGRTVTYRYNEDHYLLEMVAPDGTPIARNEYDENGRLVAVIDADGNRIEYEYDLEGKTQVVRDALGNPTVYTYDDNGNILKIVDAYGGTTYRTYNEDSKMLSETDALGNTTTYEYDANGNMVQMILPDGSSAVTTYTQDNQVSTVTSGNDLLYRVLYNEDGTMVGVEDSDGNVTRYNYTGRNLMSITDSIGVVQAFTYDADGVAISSSNGTGDTAYYGYDEKGRCISVTVKAKDGTTYTTHYSYDEGDRVVQSVDHSGAVTKYEYDYNDNVTAETDAKGNRVTYTYNDKGELTLVQYPDGTTEQFDYDANGNTISATDRYGLTVAMKYDKLNRLVSKTYPDGTKESYTYDAVGNVLTYTSVTGGVTEYEYDNRNRNTAVTDALGNRTEFTYDTRSHLIARTDALGNVTKYEYDINGRQTKTILADGTSIEAAYDARGRIVAQTDANGQTTAYAYDAADRLVKVTDALGGSWNYTYDEFGNLSTVTDALGHTTTYTYDELGRVATEQNALGGVRTYEYGSLGEVVSSTNYAGVETVYTYDELNRLVKTTTGDITTAYSYDALGRLAKVTDASGTITYTYDKYSRIASVTDARGETVSYTYDECGRTESVKTSLGTTEYDYDTMDRLVRVVDRNGQVTVYEYDAVGNRSVARYANGTEITYTYDACQRLIEEWICDKDGNTVSKYVYTLGKSGERTGIVETTGDTTVTVAYEYDALLRLTAEEYTDGKGTLRSEYTYDAVSNRTEKTVTVTGDITGFAYTENVSAGTVTYTYNALNQLLAEESALADRIYYYDANGARTRVEVADKSGAVTESTSFTYDALGRLVRATVSSGSDVTVSSYTYDYMGNRTSKTTAEETVYFITETMGSLSQVLAEVNADGSELAYYTRSDELISMETEGETYTYLSDGHSDVRALTDSNGTVTDTYRFDAYGVLLSKTGDTRNEYLYAGEQYNAETGLYYNRARYMDPTTGTFISMDSYSGSIYDPVSLHKYLYANANPVTYTDPTGYFSFSELMVAQEIQSVINTVQMSSGLFKVLRWVNAIVAVYDVFQQIKGLVEEGKSVEEIVAVMLKDGAIDLLLDGLCSTKIGFILKPVLFVFSLGVQTNQLVWAWTEGTTMDKIMYTAQAIAMVFGLAQQCFTGDTLVWTENGTIAISEVAIGDEVYTYDAETGEAILAKVTDISVSETNELVHLTIDGELIRTTVSHPFYTTSGEWKAAGDLKVGDRVVTMTGEATVEATEVEKLSGAVTVYNLTVEGAHNYYVAENGVLVHNMCQKADSANGDGKSTKSTGDADSSTYKAPDGGGGITSKMNVNGQTITFGHGGRHLEGTGLDLNMVNQSLAAEVSSKNLKVGQFFKGQIDIGGVTIEFTSYGVSEGVVNIGTYYPVKK